MVTEPTPEMRKRWNRAGVARERDNLLDFVANAYLGYMQALDYIAELEAENKRLLTENERLLANSLEILAPTTTDKWRSQFHGLASPNDRIPECTCQHGIGCSIHGRTQG